MLRTFFVTAILLYGAVQSLRGPFYGLLFYLWLAYFRPEYWLWSDWVSQLNMSLLVGLFVLVGSIAAGGQFKFGLGSMLMVLFAGQSLVSTVASPAFYWAWPFFQDFAKATMLSVLMMTLVNSEQRLRLTLVVIAGSLGAEATKQGWAQLFTNPGAVNANEHPVLGDNNGVAVGMFMLVAIIIALARTSAGKRERVLHRFMAVGVLYRALTTYSRGGFLACSALGLHFIMRSKKKFAALAGIALVALLIIPVLPDAFWDRMSTIDDATEDVDHADGSIRGRLHFWAVAVAMANDNPLTGVGHNAYNMSYDRYDFSFGEHGPARSVHSTWFGVLAELGYPGLLLFIAILANAFLICRRAQRAGKKHPEHPELQKLAAYGTAFEAALVSFGVGATFVIFQYNEMLWHVLGLSLVIDNLVKQRLAELVAEPTTRSLIDTPPLMPMPVPAITAQSFVPLAHTFVPPQRRSS